MKLGSKSSLAIRAEQLSKQYMITLGSRDNLKLSEKLGDLLAGWRRRAAAGRTKEEAFWSLQDVSFEIKAGEAVGIMGKNGAGKTTLLKILSRITEPTSGRAEIYGRVGTLLEVGTGFHPDLSGRDNVYLNGIILGMKKDEIDARFDEIVAFSGIEKYIDTPVKRYSSGMYVRLAFSVAAHLDFEVLIVDEVLAVGDGAFQKRCLGKMNEVGKQGKTVLLVSHDLPSITRLCPRAMLLNQGRLVMDGPTGSVINAYLQGDNRPSCAREWPDREKAPGNDAVRLRAVRVRNDHMTVTGVIDIGTSFSVELEYEVLKPGLILAPHFGLVTEQGDLLFLAYEASATWQDRPRKVGKYVSRGVVPHDLLTEGTYYVSAFCRTLGSQEVDIEANEVLVLQAIESQKVPSARGNIHGYIPGFIRPLLEWSTHSRELEGPDVGRSD